MNEVGLRLSFAHLYFFTGSSRDWASPQTQRAWFRDFTMTVTERF
jgi:hypothetical protein